MTHALCIRVRDMQRIDASYISHDSTYLFSLVSISLKLLLLLSKLLMHLKKRNLEETIKAALLQTRHSPLDNNIYLFLLISRLHLEFAHDESLLLSEIVSLLWAVEDTDNSFKGVLLIHYN